MHRAGALPADVTVAGFTLEPLGGGVGLTGETVRLRLTYAGSGVADADPPPTIVAKFPTTVSQNRGMVESMDCYAREICFYRDLAHLVPARIPRHLGSDFDPGPPRRVTATASKLVERLPARAHLALTRDMTKFMRASKRRYALLLEDLGPGHEVHDLVEPPPLDRLELALDNLAAVHAAFWGRTDLVDHPSARTLVTDLPTTSVNVFHGRTRAMAEQRWGWSDGPIADLLDAAAERFADDLAVINEPITLVHGDPRSDNLLFGADDVVLLDWAMPAFGHPGYDVGYLLGSSLRVEHADRTTALLERYRERLAERGPTLDADDLATSVAATARAMLVQQVGSLAVLIGDYGEHGVPADMWAPRLAAVGLAVGG